MSILRNGDLQCTVGAIVPDCTEQNDPVSASLAYDGAVAFLGAFSDICGDSES